MNILVLADSVCAISGLGIHCRVPIVVIKDNSVGSGQRYSKSASPRTQQENKDLVVSLELHDHIPPVGDRARAIKPEEAVPLAIQVVFEDVDHLRHLAEDERTVLVLLHRL